MTAPIQEPVVQEPGPFEKRLVGVFVKTFLYRRRHGKGWSMPGHFDAVPFRFRGNSGADLSGHHIRHPDPRGIVVLAHPDRRYAQHWFARSGWLDLLHDAGYDALTFDFPVYGDSHGGSTYLHEDVLAAVAEAKRLRPGLAVHVVGVSIGAFAVANASPYLDVDSILLESPYPTFTAWYGNDKGSTLERIANSAFERTWPKTAARIQAMRNIARTPVKRILISGTQTDEVTPIHLTRSVAVAAPYERTTYLEFDGVPHLDLIGLAAYREAIVEHLAGRPVGGTEAAARGASRVVPVGVVDALPEAVPTQERLVAPLPA